MKLQLNLNKPQNYAFFCPITRVHLTRSSPVGYANEVTSYIRRGLKSKCILQIDEEGQEAEVKKQPELQKETVEEAPIEETPTEETPIEEVKHEEPVETLPTPPEENEAPVVEKQEEKPSKRGRRSK